MDGSTPVKVPDKAQLIVFSKYFLRSLKVRFFARHVQSSVALAGISFCDINPGIKQVFNYILSLMLNG